MKRPVAILALILSAATVRAGDAFYVWQQLWTTNVVAAVTNEPVSEFFFLATVLPAKGESVMTKVPWPALAETNHRYVPVVRVPLKAFARTEELLRVAAELEAFDEIQIDLDCPESRLAEYAELLAKLRRATPNQKLSITALPAHLGNQDFSAVAAMVDEYTLQIHGLDVPKTIDDPAQLMNLHVAEKAIAQANMLGRPYRVALPCYAYELNFDPDSGNFLFLTAERPHRRAETLKRRIAANHEDLLRLRATSPRVIWFRLPVVGDRLCLPRSALAEIQSGHAPKNRIDVEIERVSASTIELALKNGNVIHAPTAELALDWEIPAGSFDLYHGIDAPQRVPGQLPTLLSVSIPPPGQSTKIGWFSTSTPPTINLKLK